MYVDKVWFLSTHSKKKKENSGEEEKNKPEKENSEGEGEKEEETGGERGIKLEQGAYDAIVGCRVRISRRERDVLMTIRDFSSVIAWSGPFGK
ncbi:hypothetical protein Scep_024403 [Stephania cephalantha]|uniref:Uncharacterized protein n=1 Tax=Stephania cephalantha TaxID=152367 RepID=A0AAP0F3N5_9MAGN